MSNTIAQVVLTDPPALSAVSTGAETTANTYLLTAPTLATESLTVTAPDGTSFGWKPTELVYRDTAGQMDYIVGSSPSSLSTRGREARYARTFPAADDIFIAQANGVKHWTVLHEPPRAPAEYLGSGVEFGVSGVVTGVALPVGSHTSISVDTFNFPEPIAKDLNGLEVTGRYEVVDSAEGQQLFIWFAASYLETATYPIMIDPTVVVSAAYDTSWNTGRKIVSLSNGWLIAAAWDSATNYTRYYKSTDVGTTWTQLCWSVSEAGVALASSGTTVLAVTKSTNGNTINYVKFDAATVTNTEQTNAAIFTGTGAENALSVAIDGAGAYHVAFSSYVVGYASSRNVFYTKSTDGGATWAAATQMSQYDTVGYNNWHPSIAIKSDGYPILTFRLTVPSGNNIVYAYRYNGSSWSGVNVYSNTNTPQYPFIFVKKNGSNIGRVILVYQETGVAKRIHYSDNGGVDWSAFTGIATAGSKFVIAENDEGDIYVIYENSNISYQRCPNGATAFETAVVLASSGTDPSAMEREASNSIGVIFMDASAVKFDEISFNSAPFAPTVLVRPNYDATASGVYNWTFSDPDSGNTQSAYQLLIKRVSDGVTVVDTGKVASTTSSHTLTAATLTNNVQYQWQVKTWDNKDLAGPYSSLATFWASAKPTVSITTPATDGATVATSSLTAQWSFSDPESEGQSAYQVKLTDNADVVLWDSGKVSDVNARSRTIAYTLVNSTSYKVKVTAWDAKDISSTEVVRTFTTSFTPPETPSIVIRPNSEDGYIEVVIDNSAEYFISPFMLITETSGPTISSNDILRRKLGETAWTRIAKAVPTNDEYKDYAAASGITYEYKVQANGNNGTTSDSVVLSGSITLIGVWLHDVADPAGTVHKFKYDGRGRGSDWKPEVAMMQFAGRSRPMAEFGESGEGKVSARLEMMIDDLDHTKLDTLAKRQGTICYRDGRGRKVFGVVIELPVSDEMYGYTTSIQVLETSYSETV